MAIEPKPISTIRTEGSPDLNDLVTGLDVSASTPAGKNANFEIGKIADLALSRREAIMTLEEVTAGVPTADRRGISPQRLAQAIATLTPPGTKHNFSATVPPTGSDDNTDGYSPGSVWAMPARVWICRSAATNIALWIELTGGGGADNPPTASPEEAEAGTVTELRSWSPALIAAAIEALAPGGGGEGEDNPPTASPEEAEAGTVTDLRSWSPALIAVAIEALAPGGGGGGGRWYEREAWGPDEDLTEETERDLFLVGGPGTIEWAEVETLVQNNPPTIRLLVNGVWHGPALVPNSGSGALRVGGAAMSVAVVAGDRVSVFCLHDGGVYSSLAAKGLRVGVQVKPT